MGGLFFGIRVSLQGSIFPPLETAFGMDFLIHPLGVVQARCTQVKHWARQKCSSKEEDTRIFPGLSADFDVCNHESFCEPLKLIEDVEQLAELLQVLRVCTVCISSLQRQDSHCLAVVAFAA